MAITVTHSKVSTIPDGDDSSLIRPSDWNDEHVLTGTIPVDNGGTGASTLTGYVKGNGTSAMTASSTIPNTDITGLGTASTKDAGVANGVATLDSSGKVPVSELPAAVLGALSYQGTWNASTNTPTLTSSTGTKGYYYVVDVAGNTNLNGITDWLVGDWAVFNGSVWQKIDNTETVTSVNGQTGAVVLTYSDVGAFPATSTTGTGSVVLQTSPTINTPTLSGATVDGTAPYMNYTPTTAPTYAEGRVFYDSAAHTLNYYNDNNQMSVNIGQEQIIRVRNQTGSTIPDGSVVYVSGATGNTPTVALAIATAFNTSDIIGVTTTSIPNNDFGYATVNGLVNGLDTSAFSDGNPVFLSATTAGAFTAIEPTAPNYSVQVGVIVRANPSVGTLLVATQQISTEVSHIIGTVAVSQGGTGQTSYTDGQLLIGNTTGNTLTKSTLTAGTAIGITNGAGSITVNNTGVTSAVAGTGISVSGSTGAVTVTNTAPDQTVSIASGTGISATGTYPNFTVTNTAPDQTVVLNNGTGISVTGTYPNFTVTNTAPSSGGTVTSVSGTAGRITSTGGTTPVIDLASGVATAGTTGSSTLIPVVTIDTYGRVTGITTASNPQGTVTSVTGTAPVVSSGGATPAISMAAANGSTNGYLTSTDWTTFNNKAAPVTYTANYVPYGQGTTTPALSANFTYDPSLLTLTAPQMSASNGIVCNANTIAANFTIPTNYNAMSAGPITINTGVTVTVPTGSTWVVV